MKQTSKTVIFFGSGPVAAESLKLLLKHQSVEAVITKPTTEREMRSAAGNMPVYCVATKHELEDLLKTTNFSSDLGVLIDFGIIVSKTIIDTFSLGIINSHFSLLPELRGADPITFAILSGQEKTGVSLMLLVEAMDEGPILHIAEQIIAPKMTTPELTEQLILLSDEMLLKTIPLYRAGGVKLQKQSDPEWNNGRVPSYTRKLTKDDGVLDFTKSATVLEREIRAFAGWPKSRMKLGSKDVIVMDAHVAQRDSSMPNTAIGGTFSTGKQMYVQTATDLLVIDVLKPAGKKEMTSQAFLAGYKI